MALIWNGKKFSNVSREYADQLIRDKQAVEVVAANCNKKLPTAEEIAAGGSKSEPQTYMTRSMEAESAKRGRKPKVSNE
jgi:hypothetical protein